MSAWLIIHFGISWCLIGLIWVIQVVHYPLMKQVGREEFIHYHDRHMALISWVVGPLMFAEVASAGLLLFMGERSVTFIASLVLLAIVWASTFFVQIPLHDQLTRGYDASTIQRLVVTNIWRTLSWTARGVCVGLVLYEKFA